MLTLPYSVFAADADGDGDVDVFSASINDDKIAWYENDGSNNYTERVISTNANGARSVFAADADGDGDVDVFSASVNDDKIAWYETVALPEVSIAATGTPAEAGATPGTFTIDRGTNTAGNITVFFDIAGTAAHSIDYILANVTTIDDVAPAVVTFNPTTNKGSVVIPDTQTSVDIQLIPRDDTVTDRRKR